MKTNQVHQVMFCKNVLAKTFSNASYELTTSKDKVKTILESLDIKSVLEVSSESMLKTNALNEVADVSKLREAGVLIDFDGSGYRYAYYAQTITVTLEGYEEKELEKNQSRIAKLGISSEHDFDSVTILTEMKGE